MSGEGPPAFVLTQSLSSCILQLNHPVAHFGLDHNMLSLILTRAFFITAALIGGYTTGNGPYRPPEQARNMVRNYLLFGSGIFW